METYITCNLQEAANEQPLAIIVIIVVTIITIIIIIIIIIVVVLSSTVNYKWHPFQWLYMYMYVLARGNHQSPPNDWPTMATEIGDDFDDDDENNGADAFRKSG